MRLPANPGNGLRLFAGRWDQKQYNKMIYVTAGDFPPMLNLLDPQLDVTAITVKADQQTIHMAEKGRCQQIELPLSALDNTAAVSYTHLGPVLVLGLFFLAELLAALFLFSFWQRLKAVQKKNKRESSAQIQGDELLLKKTKAALLTLRLSDEMCIRDRA